MPRDLPADGRADELKQTIRCATSGGDVEIVSNVKETAGKLSGHWKETRPTLKLFYRESFASNKKEVEGGTVHNPYYNLVVETLDRGSIFSLFSFILNYSKHIRVVGYLRLSYHSPIDKTFNRRKNDVDDHQVRWILLCPVHISIY